MTDIDFFYEKLMRAKTEEERAKRRRQLELLIEATLIYEGRN